MGGRRNGTVGLTQSLRLFGGSALKKPRIRRVVEVALCCVLAGMAGESAAAAATTGLLRVTSSPALSTQVLVDGQIADSWGLNWLKETPGTHTVCIAHVEGWPAEVILSGFSFTP